MSRESILQKIREGKTDEISLPKMDLNLFRNDENREVVFTQNLEACAGKIIRVRTEDEIVEQVAQLFPDAVKIVSCLEGFDSLIVNQESNPKDLDSLDLAILKAEFGVAENGAIWIQETNLPHRIIPFITAHLVIVLKAPNIVENMHEAYFRIGNIDEGFGVFIAGPSKTADIEQSLVIGAQGALSLVLFLVENQTNSLS